ncbi:FAD-binding oxidoreductase [Ferrimonas gelatinilytica]|uniref:FAD-binding oxidoreductase n=1 Tax=Ferrimonas gelatinilytica TaxID=1255257 RepID=A0ABP9S406_9GAMM
MQQPDPEQLKQFEDSLSGPLLTPESADYDEVRQLWNAMADKRPAYIVRCQDRADVLASLNFANHYQMEIAVRGAGHNIAGNASCDGGIMIDLSLMTDVEVDAGARRVYVQPGVTLGGLDAATAKHGLVVPTGINSTTGIAGLTLGGGFGWLTRRFGMTVDSLVGAEVVTVEGGIVYASADEEPDLFWALRGGGGNFGIVTRFDFEAYPLADQVLAGLLVFPLEQAESILKQYREQVIDSPLECNAWVVMRHAPPLPFLEESVHGTKVVILALCCTGDIEEGKAWAAKLEAFGSPVGTHVGPMPFDQWQQAFDPLLAPGARNYWKTHNFTELSDEMITVAVDFAEQLPGPECEVFFGLIAGKANTVATDATAWPCRDAKVVMNVHARWQEPTHDGSCIDWARALFRASEPYASGGAYVNFMTDDEGGRVEDAYRENYARLKAVKRRFDPHNRLHLNQNIQPD